MLFILAAPTPQQEPLDEALIRRVAAGDEQALCALYGKTSGAVYGFALSILKNPADAEDVMQDTYLKICDAAPRYRAMGKPMAWILTIARNLALMKLREGKRLSKAAWEDLEPVLTSRPDLAAEDRLVLRAAMELLSDEERQVIMLHALSGLKHREIAHILSMPLSTALSKYNRALKKLRRSLEEGWEV